MDTPKQNPLPAAQESDDLIAELARLVAHDARSQSVNSAAYARVEPEPEPVQPAYDETEGYAEPSYGDEEAVPHGFSDDPVEVSEPVFAYGNEQRAPEPVFDFGFGNDRPSASADDYGVEESDPEHDAIADLIASAEQDDFAEDASQEDDLFAAEPVQTGYAKYEPRAPEPEAPSFSADTYFPHADTPEPDPGQDADTRDPLSEIEALIGEAARVSVSAEANGGRRVRSSFLDTADYQDMKAERAVDAAESAILAAAAASGARVAHTPQPQEPRIDAEPGIPDAFAAIETPRAPVEDEPVADYPDAEDDSFSRRERRRSGFLMPAVAGTVIVAALAGGYFLFLAPSPVPSEAPVLTADAGDLKAVPENTSTPSTASESVIFNEIDGNTVPPEDEALVSRDQTNGASGADIGSVIAPEEGEIALANRPVRTVTVRPDGTIVSSDNSIAGSNVLPVDRPDVPTVPNSTLTSDPIGEAIAAAIAEDVSPAPAETAPAAIETEPTQPAATTAIDPATIPHPVPRPAGLSAQQPVTPQPQPQPTEVATAPIQPVTPPPAAATPGNVGAWVQLSSQRSEEAARADIPSLQSRYGALFNGTTLDVSRVDLGDRGIYYRVRLPQPTMADANTVCNAIKGQGGDCFVLNN